METTHGLALFAGARINGVGRRPPMRGCPADEFFVYSVKFVAIRFSEVNPRIRLILNRIAAGFHLGSSVPQGDEMPDRLRKMTKETDNQPVTPARDNE
jgi:hypothetical protein